MSDIVKLGWSSRCEPSRDGQAFISCWYFVPRLGSSQKRAHGGRLERQGTILGCLGNRQVAGGRGSLGFPWLPQTACYKNEVCLTSAYYKD